MYYRLFVILGAVYFNIYTVRACLLDSSEINHLSRENYYIKLSASEAFETFYSSSLKSGCTGKFNVDDSFKVRQIVLLEDYTKERLLSLLGFCRSKVVLDENVFSIVGGINFSSFLEECRQKQCKDRCLSVLFHNIYHFKDMYETSEDVAERLSILTAFTVSWDKAISLLRDLCSDGGFSHKYSLTEALFVLHMKPEVPNFVVRTWKGKAYDDEMLFYAKCLAGALACVLKHDKKIPEDFEFDMSPCSDNEQFVMRNIGRLLMEYVKTFPNDAPVEDSAVSKKVAVANFSSYDSSQKLKKD